MLRERLNKHHIILASRSPRRQFLLKELGLSFEVRDAGIREDIPQGMDPRQVALHLAKQKADSFNLAAMRPHTIIITADTIVTLNGEILGKPENEEEATQMLQKLSGREHQVVTAVCIRSHTLSSLFAVSTHVWFKNLCDEEINHYIQEFKPFDKAGSYGIQEWIGYIGIERIDGSYFNVMGLPVKEVYEELLKNYSYLC